MCIVTVKGQAGHGPGIVQALPSTYAGRVWGAALPRPLPGLCGLWMGPGSEEEKINFLHCHQALSVNQTLTLLYLGFGPAMQATWGSEFCFLASGEVENTCYVETI